MNDAPIISLDIETYGAARHSSRWTPLPRQNHFNPRKSEYWDRVEREDLILTCAVTIAKNDPREDGKWTKDAVAAIEPGETFILQMHRRMDQEVLLNWLRHADTIIGSNLQFDLIYLRRYLNEFKYVLDGRHTYLDTTIVAYLWNELSSSRSLKKLGPLLGQFSYDESLQSGNRFNHATDDRLIRYNCQDTHNTILVLAELAKRLPSHTHKLSPFCIKHYSDVIHSVVTMSESGIPMSSLSLESMYDDLEYTIKTSGNKAYDRGLILSGKGSALSKDAFFDAVISEIQETSPDVMDQLEVTEKTKKVSHSKKNRIILDQNLPDDSPHKLTLKLFNDFQDAQKLLSTYVYPLLLHKRNDPTNVRSSLIPFLQLDHEKFTRWCPILDTEPVVDELLSKSTPYVETFIRNSDPTPISIRRRFHKSRCNIQADCAAYPSWFITPSKVKNDSGSEGGTIQGRITCKDPSAQTFPKSIKNCIRTRFYMGEIIGIDLSQIELRVAALLSGEESMIQSYMNGLDLHADRARSLWPDYDENPDEQKSRRQVGKMMNFADLFLASANTMREQVYAQSGGDITLPIEIYQHVVRTRPEIRPTLTDWQNKLLREAKYNGIIELPFIGQSRQFSDISAERSEIVNFPVQTTASNLMMQIQNKFTRILDSKYKNQDKPLIFLQIYDAVYIDCPPNSRSIVEWAFKEALNSVMSIEGNGYWAMLCRYYNRDLVPLAFDVESLTD